MELKTWLLIIRIINLVCAAVIISFQIWYIIELLRDDKAFFVVFIRIFVPIFMILLAFTIITSEFKFAKAVEHFKFLQLVWGLALFNIFIASVLALQFSTLGDKVLPIVTSLVFVFLALCLAAMNCIKPEGTGSLIAAQE